MAVCVDCGTSGVFLRRSKKGLCQTCQEAVRGRFKVEKGRLEEAILFARALLNPRDRAPHLRRAVDSLRVLRRCEELGCGSVDPALRDAARSLTAGVAVGGVGAGGEAASGLARAAPEQGSTAATRRENGEERRRAERRPAVLPVRLGKGGIRALTTDVSATGLCIHAPVGRAPGTRIGVRLEQGEELANREGVVRWVRNAGPKGRGHELRVMGLEISPPLNSIRRPRDSGNAAR